MHACAQLLRDIHTDMGRDGTSTVVDGDHPASIVVQAKAAGLPAATITITVSTDPKHLPLSVASASTIQ